MKMPEKIESERLVLIPISQKYAKVIFHEFTEDITTFMFPASPKVIGETEAYINSEIEKRAAGTSFAVVVVDKLTNEFIGCSGVHHIDTETPETGVWIKKSAQGNKYGLEAVGALVSWANENLKYIYVTYPVDKENIPSKKIPDALGGIIEDEYKLETPSGKILDCVEYRIFKK